MTFAKILILILLLSIFGYTAYKFVRQCIDYKKKKQQSVQEHSETNIETNNKEV